MVIISETTSIAYVYRDTDGNFLAHKEIDSPPHFTGVAATFDSHESMMMDRFIKNFKIKCKKQKVKITHTVVLVEDQQ